jgi:hypothetical protein
MATQNFLATPMRAMPLGEGDAGTAQTVAHIRQLVHQGVKSPRVNQAAIAIVWNTPQFTQTPKAQAIFSWIQQNTRFIADMVGPLGGIETLRSADEILRVRAGDCDDFSILIPALLGTIGIRSRLVTIAHHADEPQEFSHIYPEAFVDGQWVAMDVARPNAAFGRSPEKYFRKRIWDLYSKNYSDVAGLSGYVSCLRPGLGRLGQGDFDFSQLVPAIAPITSGTAQIIAASRAAPQNIVASSIPLSSQQQSALLASTPAMQAGYAAAYGAGDTTWLWLIMLGAVVLVVANR